MIVAAAVGAAPLCLGVAALRAAPMLQPRFARVAACAVSPLAPRLRGFSSSPGRLAARDHRPCPADAGTLSEALELAKAPHKPVYITTPIFYVNAGA